MLYSMSPHHLIITIYKIEQAYKFVLEMGALKSFDNWLKPDIQSLKNATDLW